MSKPIRVSPDIKADIIGMVETLIARDKIPYGEERDRIDDAFLGLREGFDINVRILFDAAEKYGNWNVQKRVKELGSRVDLLKRVVEKRGHSYEVRWEYDRDRFPNLSVGAETWPKSGWVAIAHSHIRAQTANEPLGHEPSEFLTYVFEPIGSITSAKNTPFGKEGRFAFDFIQSAVSANIAAQLEGPMRISDEEIGFPPLPSTPEFHRLVVERLGLATIDFDAWRGLEYWNLALSFVFADLLIQGAVPVEAEGAGAAERSAALLAGWRAAVEKKAAWLTDLKRIVDIEFVESAIARRYEERPDDKTLALAELSRFGTLPNERPRKSANAADVFYRNLIALHRMFPLLEGRDFASLTAPILRPMEFEGVKALLKGLTDDAEGFNRFKGRLIYLWHSEDHDRFIAELAKVVKDNKKYKKLEKFLARRIDATVEAFISRVTALKERGVDVWPLVDAVKEKFEGELESMPEALYLLHGEAIAGGMRAEQPREAQEDDEDDEVDVVAHAESAADATVESGTQLILPIFAAPKIPR